ncbi:Hypothetical protein NTJ_15690 [Nesidiocoris tenuis]|uniref:Uncharacterized protein n=1 Tax=Nesidiocoris tenuis TaxID=355587 RepID=A0ABN7BHT1_9HEMI|nr:Hypothetical protein NTJ_15690 [Nesidiocoris tenuis]
MEDGRSSLRSPVLLTSPNQRTKDGARHRGASRGQCRIQPRASATVAGLVRCSMPASGFGPSAVISEVAGRGARPTRASRRPARRLRIVGRGERPQLRSCVGPPASRSMANRAVSWRSSYIFNKF